MPLNKVTAVLCREKMTEQQGNPDQLPAEKGQGGAGATYKVPNWRSVWVCWNKSEMEWTVILCNGGDQTSSSSPPVLQLAVFEYENFRGKKVELSGECKDAFEKTQRIGSVIVESGPWVIPLFFVFVFFNCSASFLLVVWPCFRLCVMPFLCVPSDGWGLSVQAMQESSLCWRKGSILGGAPGPTARVSTASAHSGLWKWSV